MQFSERYQPLDAVNDGSMSDAFICVDRHLERKVFVKSLDFGTDQRRLLDELAALQSIRSKHVVEIYDVIRDERNGITAIVEEYLPGENLTTITLPNTAMEFFEAVFPIAKGIADIHEHGVIHRDVKPQNMKFDSEGYLKVFDFGLARTDGAELNTVGAIGTRGYMAPELFDEGIDGKVWFSKAIDTYAFGATALVLGIGKLPKEMWKSPPVVPCAEGDFKRLPFPLPADVTDRLNRCIARDPEDRPSMSDVAGQLGSYLLEGRHRALLVAKQKSYVLDNTNRAVRLNVAERGSLLIRYDGFKFLVDEVEGMVMINNIAAVNGTVLPGSCVIVLGQGSGGAARTMITVDISNPEVGL